MNYVVGMSSQTIPVNAIEEATKDLKNPKLVIFCSSINGFTEYSEMLKSKFPKALVIGATSYVGLCKKKAYKEGLVVAGIEDGIECYGDVLEKIDQYPLVYVERIEKSVEKLSNTENVICFELTTGLVNSEESVLTTLNAVLESKKIPVFGATAGDDAKAGYTMVSYNGKVYKNGCVFVMIRNLGGKIKVYRENIYKPIGKYHIATKVDSSKRMVYEYDHKPAAKVMAEDLGVSVSELPKYLDQYPWGRIMGKEVYITANREILKDDVVAYHARVYKNAQMVLLKPDNYKEINIRTLQQVKRDIPKPSFTIVVNCLARSLLFEGDSYLNEFSQRIGEYIGDYIGFSGYGEQEGRQHFNQTMVIAVFE